MNRFLLITFLASLALNAYQLLKGIDGSMGGGVYKQSPNERFTVGASSLKNINPLAEEKEFYAEVTLHEGFISGDVLKKFKISPIYTDSEMSYRDLEEPIKWNEDSSKVTVTTPEYEITINLNTEPVDADNPDNPPLNSKNQLDD